MIGDQKQGGEDLKQNNGGRQLVYLILDLVLCRECCRSLGVPVTAYHLQERSESALAALNAPTSAATHFLESPFVFVRLLNSAWLLLRLASPDLVRKTAASLGKLLPDLAGCYIQQDFCCGLSAWPKSGSADQSHTQPGGSVTQATSRE